MIKKILIANRGEIAVRIVRACSEMRIKSVAIYTDADRHALHVKKADESYNIGSDPVIGYLNAHNIVNLAVAAGCDALHPGYGFLSENPVLAEICAKRGITFIGPSAKVIQQMGDKIEARKAMIDAGIPVIPGSEHNLESVEEARELANKIGYPVMLKATNGGGGRGIRRCNSEAELIPNYDRVVSEASKAFGKPEVFLEKCVVNPKHIEVQIIGDSFGHAVHLFERDCSIQRRNQKVVEETPSPLIENKFKKLRDKMGKAAVKIAEAANYTNAGTVEFLVDNHGNFFFLEMNKRIQVEHPITEEVTGIDLVRYQIMLAMGETLRHSQGDVQFKGHAIECRINAEDPFDDFRPSPGRIEMYYQPGGRGVRVDTHAYAGYTIPPTYDSMIGKLITYGKDRREAMDKMSRALGEYMLTGVKTTISFQQAILQDPNFRRGVYSTNFVEQLLSGARRELIEEKA